MSERNGSCGPNYASQSVNLGDLNLNNLNNLNNLEDVDNFLGELTAPVIRPSYFRTVLGEFVYYRTYARWISSENRREHWPETVSRYMQFMHEQLGERLSGREYDDLYLAILNQEIVPSMRLLQFAGAPVRKTNVCAYNCSFVAPTELEDFAEIMYVLMCGSGVGFSVESKHVKKLPVIEIQSGNIFPKFVIPDSREGWCDALKHGLRTWYSGADVLFDFSLLRPAGARLKTMGGKSSGPDPLKQLLSFVRERIFACQGKQLSTLDVHDIICMIGNVVVAGGVRRSALISLSDLHDTELRDAKKGAYYVERSYRCRANNSAVYMSKPSAAEFLDEWLALVKSGSGERGIFNRGGLAQTLSDRRRELSADYLEEFGTNPCGEIILRSKQFCNLSEIIARPEDTPVTLARKLRLATVLGTYQSTLTDFQYLSPVWQKNCQDERLLGVSITGQWDCAAVRNDSVLQNLKTLAEETNREYAKRFGINPSASITCIKPSGTVSSTFDTASGMHPRFAKYYVRRVRIAATDALLKMLREQGVSCHPEVGQTEKNADTFVLEFPMKSPDDAIVRTDISALDQLEHWKLVKKNYTEHNPSVTISVADDEWIKVAHWVYENWDIVGGLSFLPKSDCVYQLMPYEEITEARYHELKKTLDKVDFARIVEYEREDQTDVKAEMACLAGQCDVI